MHILNKNILSLVAHAGLYEVLLNPTHPLQIALSTDGAEISGPLTNPSVLSDRCSYFFFHAIYINKANLNNRNAV